MRWAVGIFTFAITLASAFLIFQSKIEITCGASTDRTNPWSVPFTVTNAGFLPVYNIKWIVTPITTNFKLARVKPVDAHFGNYGPFIPDASELNSGQKTTLFPWGQGDFGPIESGLPGDRLLNAEIVCSVDYENVLHWKQKLWV